jgi:hypothetical protein
VSLYLSKSDFKVARTCATKLYYRKLGYASTRDDDEYLQFLADGGYMVEAIAKLLYPEGIEIGFEKGLEASAAATMRLLQTQERLTLFEATLIFGQRLARVERTRRREVFTEPTLRKHGNATPFLPKRRQHPRHKPTTSDADTVNMASTGLVGCARCPSRA